MTKAVSMLYSTSELPKQYLFTLITPLFSQVRMKRVHFAKEVDWDPALLHV